MLEMFLKEIKPIRLFTGRVCRRGYAYILGLCLLMALSGFSSCKKPTEPQEDSPGLKLTLLDVGSREVYLKLERATGWGTVTVTRNGTTIFTVGGNGGDTVLVDEGLEVSSTYTYKATAHEAVKTAYASAGLTAVTLGVSNNNFTCYMDTLGYGGHLNDAFIIDNNNIWLAGLIETKEADYNAARWNGSKWEYFYVASSIYNDQGVEVGVGHPDLLSVFGFNKDNVWFCTDLQLIHWNGHDFTRISVPRELYGIGRLVKIWGTSSNDMYVVGANGVILHYDGVHLTRMKTDTGMAIGDIYGIGSEVYAAGTEMQNNSAIGGGLLKLTGGEWKTVMKGYYPGFGFKEESHLKSQLFGPFGSVWMNKSNSVYLAGHLFYQNKGGRWDYFKYLPENHPDSEWTFRNYIGSIRGNAANDLFLCGPCRFFYHFNGVEWKNVYLPYSLSSFWWVRADVKGNTAVVVGFDGFRGYVLRAYR